jgi:hypothetical protein
MQLESKLHRIESALDRMIQANTNLDENALLPHEKYFAEQVKLYQKLTDEERKAVLQHVAELFHPPTIAKIQKFLAWVFTASMGGRNGLELMVTGEDQASLKGLFSAFEEAKKKREFEGQRDMGKYSNFDDFSRDVGKYIEKTLERDRNIDWTKPTLEDDDGLKLICCEKMDDKYKVEVYAISTPEACQKYLTETTSDDSKSLAQKIKQGDRCLGRWCVKTPDHYQRYKDSNLYLFVVDGFFAYLMHVVTGEFTNASNQPFDSFSENEKKKVEKIIFPLAKKHIMPNYPEKVEEIKEGIALWDEIEEFKKEVVSAIAKELFGKEMTLEEMEEYVNALPDDEPIVIERQ